MGSFPTPVLAKRLQDQIDRNGPIRFRDWMDACLYDPEEGYYMRPQRKTGAGNDADFATSPTLHPFLAQCVAKEIRAAWERAGKPAKFPVWEFGGGEGDLARAAKVALFKLRVPAVWKHIEKSPFHQMAQAESGEQVSRLPPRAAGFVVAHEFLDALPFALLQKEDEWKEVAWDGDEEVLLPAASTGSLPQGDWEEGRRLPAMSGIRQWFQELSDFLGEILVIDYGAEGRKLWDRDPTGGTVRTYRHHQDGGTPYEDPGEKDITASIDFEQTRLWGTKAGFREAYLANQQTWLVEHGALEEINAIGRDTMEDASAYLRLRQMILGHGGGMGEAFMVQRFERAG